MLALDRFHDPSENKELLQKIAAFKPSIDAVQETDRLFERYKSTLMRYTSWKEYLLSLRKNRSKTFAAAVTHNKIEPAWMPLLHQEYQHLMKKIKKEVNILDFGAVGDGKTDNTEAFKKAIGSGKVKLIIPEGVYIIRELKLPSWTYIKGVGKGKTTLKLHEEAPKNIRLVTNKSYVKGNHHIFVEGMTLDWNVERLGDVEKTSSGGNQSSCLTLAHVTYGWVRDVEAVNAGLHGFDVTSAQYHYRGDGYKAPRRSKYVWLDHLTGYGFGDDGITTHHSDHIFISRCHMCEPSGRAHQEGYSNSNGIEVDDGSTDVFLLNNSTARCFGGVEIKAHHNASAASCVQIIGHISVNDNRSYNFRHIGHHKDDDPHSKTAFNIKATDLVSIAPIYTHLYRNSTPRAMVISAYQNVVIHNFTIIGDPHYDFKNNPVIAIQYRADQVILKNVFIHNFRNAKGIKGKYLKL